MTLTEKIFTLKSIAPFNNLTDQELIITANITQEKNYKDGDLIYTNGNALYSLYIIANGEVVSKNEKRIVGIFGFNELVIDEVINEDICAKGDVSMLLISKAHLLTLIYESPSIMIEFLSLKEGADA
ncbi:MAG: cyclic nucleotide-binding domain-containing protein [Campylobacteraceae bacterium]|nr:cyclic nucleotide-binding domain-containing protein [Campylobacteraceae bacterium]